MSRRARLFLVLVLGVSSALMLTGAATVRAQPKAPPPTMQRQAPALEKHTPAVPVIVELGGLWFAGSQRFPGRVQMKQWDRGAFHVRITNRGAGTVANIPWIIKHAGSGTTLGSGTVPSLTAGQFVEVTAPWTVSLGTHMFQAQITPGNTLKNTAAPAKQSEERTYTVIAEPDEKMLTAGDFSGTHSVAGDVSSNLCRVRGQVSDNNSPQISEVDCRNSIAGARVTLEAFKGVQLKNGWKVKSANYGGGGGSGVTVSWEEQPAVGNSSPYARIRIAVEPGQTSGVGVHITIEGERYMPWK